ncbi:hypothetical protein MnBA_33110 [Marinobacterium sp. BA1]
MNAIVKHMDVLMSKILAGHPVEKHPEMDALLSDIESHVLAKTRYISTHSSLPFKGCETYATLEVLPAEEKIEFLLYLISQLNHNAVRRSSQDDDPEYLRYLVHANLLDTLMRTRIDFPDGFSFFQLFRALYGITDQSPPGLDISSGPFTALVMQIEKHIKRWGLNEIIAEDISNLIGQECVVRHLRGETRQGCWAAKKLERILVKAGESGIFQMPAYELGGGPFGSLVQADMGQISAEERGKWHHLFHHLSMADGGTPSQKFLNTLRPLVDEIGVPVFRSCTNRWLAAAAQLQMTETEYTEQYIVHTYTYRDVVFIEAHSFSLLKGLLWLQSGFHDPQTLQSIALLTEKCFQKIPGHGPVAASVGNAGIYALAQSPGLAGISHLSRLKLRIRQNNTQKLIQNFIDEQAARQGIRPAQIEEIAVPDFGLNAGERVEAFDDYRLVLKHSGVGATQLQWIKPDGSPQKTAPAFVKNSANHSAKLKQMRALEKQVKQSSTSQRDRIDRLYLEDMRWSKDDFETYYLHHGLVADIARKLIWALDGTPALYHDEHWQNVNGELLVPADIREIRLWHPIDSSPEEVLAWRDRLEELAVSQPFKQAYREVYILTDAEINTRLYSNRMAAHILKQHQFNSLAAIRGWKYSLLGIHDDDRNGGIARRTLPAYNLEAQYWINEIADNVNDVGIWYYVASDQLRFCRDGDEPVPLTDIPPLVLSEIMRDLDLFVGVASVGNDPQWQDGGPEARPQYREYWQSYSFGDLTEVAKTRKAVLERLLPKLKIRDKTHIDGKFLFVEGSRHTYKIHIGSGNILICPNDRYLCIVPSRSKNKHLSRVFLPFEGDSGLSIVLSKAFMLAEDDKITDSTILRQL